MPWDRGDQGGSVAGATTIAAASKPAAANLPRIDCDRGLIRRSLMARY